MSVPTRIASVGVVPVPGMRVTVRICAIPCVSRLSVMSVKVAPLSTDRKTRVPSVTTTTCQSSGLMARSTGAPPW